MEVPEDIYNKYKKLGYNKEQIHEAFSSAVEEHERKELQEQLDDIPQEETPTNITSSQFETVSPDDLIKYQLELNSILERVEHLLRGDIVKFEKGNRFYTKDINKKFAILNEYGVQMVMNVLQFYLNRNTILSNLSKEEVYQIINNFGKELTDLFYMKYNEMGLDTEKKRQQFTMMIIELIDMVRNAYSRAIDGQERRGLREARQVHQTQQLLPENYSGTSSGNPINPKNWFKSSI